MNIQLRRLSFVAAIALLFGTATPPRGLAQFNMDAPNKPKGYILYAAEAQTVPAGRPAMLELRFQVLPGYHVNSHTPRSQYLIPTALSLQTANGVKADALEYPVGKPYSFAFDPSEKLDVYADAFTVKLPVVAVPGNHTLDGTLRYQACDNAACYQPQTLPVKVVFTAK